MNKEKFLNELKEEWANASVLVKQYSEDKVKSKYGSKRLSVNDVKYDSQNEYFRHIELLLLQKYGEISNLRFHDKIDVVYICRNPDIRYIPDFTYNDKSGNFIIEDVKGIQTPDFIIKKKIMISKIRNGELNAQLILTRKLKDGFIIFEEYSQFQSYIKPKKIKKKT